MAKSKGTLIAEITAEAKNKGVEIPVTEGLDATQLAETLKGLTELPAKAPAPAPAPAPETNTGNDDDPEPDEKPKFPYSVGPGKSITTKRGILADGEEITKKDIPEISFKAFIKSGHIKKG